jgi:hypothetical protein
LALTGRSTAARTSETTAAFLATVAIALSARKPETTRIAGRRKRDDPRRGGVEPDRWTSKSLGALEKLTVSS